MNSNVGADTGIGSESGPPAAASRAPGLNPPPELQARTIRALRAKREPAGKMNGGKLRNTREFDVVVVGGGSGLSVARHAHREGKSVALIESRPQEMGGTGVNRGCIPSKSLLLSAQVMTTVRQAAAFGVLVDQASVRVDFAGIMRAMRRQRAADAAAAKRWVDRSLTPFYARARFIGEKLLETEDGQRITGDKIFIATGSRPALPPIASLAEVGYWTNDDVVELEHRPASLIVVGGGYVGVEFAHFFAALGTEVTLVDRVPCLPHEDDEVRDCFTREFADRVRLLTGHRALRVVAENGAKGLVLERPGGERFTVRAEALLLAAGRQPNTAELGLPATGVELDDLGAVQVDGGLRTAHPDIYAYGDVIGQEMFKHTSGYEGELAYRNSQGADLEALYLANPHAIFTDPQIGSVGLTEQECRSGGLHYRAIRRTCDSVVQGRMLGSPPGFAKLLLARDSGRILGFHMIGPQAAELVHEVVVAMNAGSGSVDLVRRAIHVHPTMAELVGEVFDCAV